MYPVEKIRNLAIIAHIDHGKTTLIDSIFRSVHVFRDNQQMGERVMDSNELERERGITIRSKHCTVEWNGYLINIIDTPGHADFSGEVERVLSMVDSVLLLVDANEGPMPQTRYVLMRSLKLGIKPIVIVNKVDRPQAQPDLAHSKTFDLFIELGANDEQCDFPILYGSGLAGWLVRDLEKDKHEGMEALFETIVEKVPPPQVDQDGPFLMQVSTLAWSDYIGRIGCGRVLQGKLKKGAPMRRTVTRWREPGHPEAGWDEVGSSVERAVHMWVTRGLDRTDADEISAGDIVWLAGPNTIEIGDTFSAPDLELALRPLEIEEPTVSMLFLVNTGPFAGDEGKAITLRQLKERLDRELHVNVALRVEDVGRGDGVKVSGRGELHLGILIEEMRREGCELCVSRPEVITHRDEETGDLMEPIEQLIIDVPEAYQGVVIEKLARRKGEMKYMENHGTGVLRLEFEIPTRGLIGYRNEFLTDTRGLGIMASRFNGYDRWRGEIAARNRGSLVSMEPGQATAYQIENLQARASLFIEPMDKIYAGQIVGENSRPDDMPCNPTKKKALTNHRSSTKDQTTVLNVARKMTLDQALEWIAPDELVEVTPESIRMRKAILDAEQRKKAEKRTAVGVA